MTQQDHDKLTWTEISLSDYSIMRTTTSATGAQMVTFSDVPACTVLLRRTTAPRPRMKLSTARRIFAAIQRGRWERYTWEQRQRATDRITTPMHYTVEAEPTP